MGVAAGVLYFPYISVPDDAWFTRVLLYWDQVGSIVPKALANEPERLTPFMQELMRAGLVTPIEPDTHHEAVEDDLNAFLDFVDADPEIEASRSNWGSEPAQRGSVRAGATAQIHGRKIGGELGRGLVERGLARPQGTHSYAVESRTAAAYMCFLAGALGRLPQIDMDPITDGVDALAPFDAGGGSGLDTLRRLQLPVLEHLLPAPEARVDVAELARFKKRHGDELQAFRRAVDSALIDVAAIADPDLQRAKAELVRQDLAGQVDALRSRMQERRWPRIVFGTICGVLAVTIPGAQALAAGSLVTAGLAVPGAASGLYALLAGRDRAPGSPLAYAALAQERLGV